MAVRCPECKETSIKRGDGTVTIRHLPDCESGNDYQPKLHETLSMRDIVVPSSLDELYAVVQGVLQKYIDGTDYERRWPEAHFVLECAENRGFDGSFIEIRGHVRNVLDEDAAAASRVFVTLDSEELRAFAYKSEPSGDESIPVEDSGVDISRLLRGNGTFELIFLSFQLKSVSIIHSPSPLIPMISQSH